MTTKLVPCTAAKRGALLHHGNKVYKVLEGITTTTGSTEKPVQYHSLWVEDVKGKPGNVTVFDYWMHEEVVIEEK